MASFTGSNQEYNNLFGTKYFGKVFNPTKFSTKNLTKQQAELVMNEFYKTKSEYKDEKVEWDEIRYTVEKYAFKSKGLLDD